MLVLPGKRTTQEDEMKRKRYSEEQIIGMLKQHEAGTEVKNLIRQTVISE
jgi:putative transposase